MPFVSQLVTVFVVIGWVVNAACSFSRSHLDLHRISNPPGIRASREMLEKVISWRRPGDGSKKSGDQSGEYTILDSGEAGPWRPWPPSRGGVDPWPVRAEASFHNHPRVP